MNELTQRHIHLGQLIVVGCMASAVMASLEGAAASCEALGNGGYSD